MRSCRLKVCGYRKTVISRRITNTPDYRSCHFTQAASGPLATVSEIEDFYHRLTDYAVGFNRTPKYGHAHVTKFFSKLSVIVNMYQI